MCWNRGIGTALLIGDRAGPGARSSLAACAAAVIAAVAALDRPGVTWGYSASSMMTLMLSFCRRNEMSSRLLAIENRR